MGINSQTRAYLLRKALKGIPEGKTITCDGLNDNYLCPNPCLREPADCIGCTALELVETSIDIELVKKGTIRKERSI